MNPWPVEADVPEVHLPRPGHADLAGRPEVRLHRRAQRARARERPRDRRARGGRRARQGVPARARRRGRLARHRRSARCARPSATASRSRTSPTSTSRPCAAWTPRRARAMVEEINVLRKRNESLGGVFEVRAFGARARARARTSPGRSAWTGASAWRCSRSRPSRAAGSATGSTSPGAPGSEAHDEIFFDDERGYYRETNRSGGIEGGMTTGEPLVVRCAMKPLPTLTKPLRSVDIATREPAAGAARAHGLLRRARPPAWWGRRCSRSCSPAPTARSSAATTSTTCARRSPPTSERIGWKRRRP